MRHQIRTRRLLAFAVAAASVLVLIAASVGSAAPRHRTADIKVLAAASLTNVFPQIDSTPAYSFAGSDALAAQIRLGARRMCSRRPTCRFRRRSTRRGWSRSRWRSRRTSWSLWCRSRTRRDQDRLRPPQAGHQADRRDADRPDRVVHAHDPAKPGIDGRAVERGQPGDRCSRDPQQGALGEADAGFVYITDAKTVTDKVNVISLPAWAQPPVRYGITVIKTTSDRSAAVAFINKVLSPQGQAKLRASGFGPVKRRGPTPRIGSS